MVEIPYAQAPRGRTRLFAKLKTEAARAVCELQVLSFSAGLDRRNRLVSSFDVFDDPVYQAVVVPAAARRQVLQFGVEYPDGQRILITGRVKVRSPRAGSAVCQITLAPDVKLVKLEAAP